MRVAFPLTLKHGGAVGIPASHLCNSGNIIDRVHFKRVRHWFFFRYYWHWRGGINRNNVRLLFIAFIR
ncbi:Uncharacterised protein [Klebsiella pneumoniae]|uniref:Uncharacterized protein n=1 Tax=Klebsiella pneumoniae TaxID=573 RepID=A0A8B4VVX6_KLEPN|nr:Uncharacterised protein [Klebsiella pneumoniae]